MKIAYIDENGKKRFLEVDEVEVIGDDEKRPLFNLKLEKDGSLEVHTYTASKFDGVIKDEAMIVEPKSKNTLNIHRKDY